jgi:hypothetical protein
VTKIIRVARTKRLTIRLSDTEQAEVKTKAERLGLSDAEYGRRTLLGCQIQSNPVPQVNREIYQILALMQIELRKQGANLIEIAKFTHSNQQLPQESNEEFLTVKPLIEKLSADIKQMQSKMLGKE